MYVCMHVCIMGIRETLLHVSLGTMPIPPKKLGSEMKSGTTNFFLTSIIRNG